MPHSWNEKQTTRLLHLFDTTVFLAHFFVVVHGVQRRKPWITYAVIKDQLPLWPENVERLVHVASPILAVASDASTHAALSASNSVLDEVGFTGLLPLLSKMPGMRPVSMIPASNGNAG